MKGATVCLLLGLTLSARGSWVERAFIPNVPAVATFLPDATHRTAGGVAADFNGDGIVDLAVIGDANFPGSGAILFGTSSGRMIPRPLESSIRATFIAAADFNGDGKPDLATGDTSTIVVRLSLGDGTFGPEQIFAHAGGNETITALATGDFDGDGKVDLLIAGAGGLTVYGGRGDGTFAVRGTTSFRGYRHDLAVGDFNHDGKLDVATLSWVDSVLIVARGKGDGTFTDVQEMTFAADPKLEMHLVSADFDGDAVPDLAVASGEGLHILHGVGDGTFRRASLVPLDWEHTWGEPVHLLAADFNGDGRPDLVAVATFAMARFTNEGGQLVHSEVVQLSGENIPFAIKSLPIRAFAADVDGDGAPDLLELDGLGFVSVLMSGCASPLILRTAADAVVAGDPLTLQLYDAAGAVSTQATFRDGTAVIGVGAGSLTTALQTAGRHVLSATTPAGDRSELALVVHDGPSTVTLADPKPHTSYGEGVHLSGVVMTDLGEAPLFGDVEIEQGATILATVPVIDGHYDLRFNPVPGTYDFVARYRGAGPWPKSSPSTAVRQVVDVTPTTLSVIRSTAGEICQFKFPPRLIGTWGFTVQVSAPFGVPTGTVTVTFPQLGLTDTEGLVDGLARFGFGRVPQGMYSFTATYGGDAGYAPRQLTGTITIPACHPRAAGH